MFSHCSQGELWVADHDQNVQVAFPQRELNRIGPKYDKFPFELQLHFHNSVFDGFDAYLSVLVNGLRRKTQLLIVRENMLIYSLFYYFPCLLHILFLTIEIHLLRQQLLLLGELDLINRDLFLLFGFCLSFYTFFEGLFWILIFLVLRFHLLLFELFL